MAIRVLFDVDRLSDVLRYFDELAIYRSDDGETGTYNEITSPGNRIELTPEREQYYYYDDDGVGASWYKARYHNSVSDEFGEFGSAIQGSDTSEKVGYTFGNYIPPPGEWGEVYTPDDMRYTMMFGVDSVGSDIAQSEWTDEQFRQVVREALGEFESYLTIDIRRRKYITNPDDALVQSKYWRDGVDYTNEDDPYDFDPTQWQNYGFIQLRHWPVISVSRAIWYSPIQSEILNLVDRNWVRVSKQFGQLRLFPKGQFDYGPYAGAYGPLWAFAGRERYPDAFEFDYETGFKNADLMPDALRSVIAKYATIKCLAAIGDGILAGFSSQSVSLDGLSESFSSTQSATSAYFGARIKQYSDEIAEWLKVNRYKFSPVPISFVGA